jgi:hypothetical protein
MTKRASAGRPRSRYRSSHARDRVDLTKALADGGADLKSMENDSHGEPRNMSTSTASKVEHQLGELQSPNPRKRAYMLRVLSECPPTDPAVIAACERLLDDTAITLLSIPYRFGELRAVAAETVWAIRSNLGIDDVVVVPDALPICSANDVAALARRAGFDIEGRGTAGTLATLEKLVAANRVPRHEIRLETVRSKL